MRITTAAVTLVLVASLPRLVHACGCFAPPDPSVPIVQAGERILFAAKDGVVTAHIQIQYEGSAGEFGWLLPLPSVPTLELGTDELFTDLVATTQPKYQLTTTFDDCGTPTVGCGSSDSQSSPGFFVADMGAKGAASDGGQGPLVLQASVGPYDYAVLKADVKDDMVTWLNDNHYFIPAGTTDAVGPYIHPGAYFLALKLRAGQSTGDLQPVVVKYPSDLPMIPIVLTSVAAKANMGIQVWTIGEARGIPRNYAHVVVNDAQLNWQGAASNYNDVIIRAVAEAPGKHAFVTEYADTSAVMATQLWTSSRFTSEAMLGVQTKIDEFIPLVIERGYAQTMTNRFGPSSQIALPAPLLAILERYIPVPPVLAQMGLTTASFYSQIRYYLGDYQLSHPEEFVGWEPDFKPIEIAHEIETRIVAPLRDAQALVDSRPYLTRLYTTLSPEDMTIDPVFSFSTSLPRVSNIHQAQLRIHCDSTSTLTTEQSWVIENKNGAPVAPSVLANAPFALRIEALSEEGGADILVDNANVLGPTLAAGRGCKVSPQSEEWTKFARLAFAWMCSVALIVAIRRRRA